MSRKPVDQMANSREPEGRQPIWETIRGLNGAWFKTRDVFGPTWINRRTITSYLACLVAGGYLEKRNGDDGLAEYRLLRDVGMHAPKLRKDGTAVTMGGGNDNMWRSMRILRQFSPLELAIHSTTDTIKVSQWSAKSYCRLLLATGYLRTIRKAQFGAASSQAVYRLIRNSGPKHPEVQRIKQIFDPNTKVVYRQDGAA
jgi:hypothetical protein